MSSRLQSFLDPAEAAKFGQLFSTEPLYLLIAPYIVFQPIFRNYVQKSQVYEKNKPIFKNIMGAYNIIMSIFSLACAVSMIYCLANLKDGVYAVGHATDPKVGKLYNFVVYLFYVSKYIEFLDTYFLILCSRPVSWLQYLHHIGAPLDMGILYHYGVEGTWIFVVFNGIIHTIMYYYYACCILKWKFPLPKQVITSSQLLQFVTGLGCYWPYAFIAGYWAVYAKRAAFYFTYAYVLMNLVMFMNFFYVNYIKASKIVKTQKKKNESKDSLYEGINKPLGKRPSNPNNWSSASVSTKADSSGDDKADGLKKRR